MAVFFSFLWGLWWALKDEVKPLIIKEEQEVRVLSPEGIFPNDLVERAEKEKFKITLTTKKTSYELLREILSPSMKYDVIVFSSILSDSVLLSNYLRNHFNESIYDDLGVSIDFRSLKFDPENKYTIPLMWNVYGWLIPQSKSLNYSLMLEFEDLGNQKLKVFSEPMLIYTLMQKIFPQAQSLLKTGNEDELKKIFNRASQKIALRDTNIDSSELMAHTQIRHTEQGLIQNEELAFVLPMEAADLEVLLLGIGKETKDRKAASDFIEWLFEEEIHKALLEVSHMASAATRVEGLSQYQRPDYIRELPISRLGIPAAHEAYEPLFTEFLKEEYPKAIGSE